MDKLRAMATFVAIAEQGSLTAAAVALDSSLPAVVRQLAAYEAALGVRLFNRTTRRISLTDDGRQHLERCRELLAAIEDAEGALTMGSSEATGTLTVTAPVLFGQLHVAPAVTGFLARHERVSCRVVLLDRVVDLLEEGIDVGIRIGHLEDSSLVALPVGQVRRVVVAAPAFLTRHGVPRHPRDLGHAPCVRELAPSSAWGPFVEAGRRFHVNVDGRLAFNHIAPAVEACAAGAGYGRFLSYQVAQHLEDKTLRPVLEDFEEAPRPIHIVFPHARLLPTRTRLFIDWMKDALKPFQPRPTPK